MKFFSASLLLLLPVLAQVEALSIPRLASRQLQENSRGGHKGAASSGSKNNAGSTTTAAASASATSAAASGSNAGSAASSGAGSVNAADAQTSLTLDNAVLATGFEQNGQENVTEAGQVPSLTSSNNFINFCLTVPNLAITNGQQVTAGSCNPAPMGAIPSTSNMPSAKFVNPANGGTVPANTAFTITMAVSNLETGNFVNAETNYFSAPQQLNAQGQIIGHSHVVVETLTSTAQTTPTDPTKFAFFKGLNAAAVGGVLTADVTSGLPAAAYRLCSINTAANHQPALVPIAQHGSLDDCVYFTATDSGAAAASGNSTAAAAASTSAAAAGSGAAAASSSAAAAASTSGANAAGAAGKSGAAAKSGANAAGAAAKAAAGGKQRGRRSFFADEEY